MLEISKVLRQRVRSNNRDCVAEQILSNGDFYDVRSGEDKKVSGVVVCGLLGNENRPCIGFSDVINGKGLAIKEVYPFTAV